MRLTVDEISYEFEYEPRILAKLPHSVMTAAIAKAEEDALVAKAASDWSGWLKDHGLNISPDCIPQRLRDREVPGSMLFRVACDDVCMTCNGKHYCYHCKSECGTCEGSGVFGKTTVLLTVGDDFEPVSHEVLP